MERLYDKLQGQLTFTMDEELEQRMLDYLRANLIKTKTDFVREAIKEKLDKEERG